MILPAQNIRRITPTIITPFVERSLHRLSGMTYGLGPAGYDVRIAENILLKPGSFALASTIERFNIPTDIVALVKDKSSWARQGIALQNTVAEPGWIGWLTLEITNHSSKDVLILEGSPIAQILFHRLEEATEKPYTGKYQNQLQGPQPVIFEK
jgi:dCTP deaminase